MEILKNIKKGILQGIGILLVLILSGATYAAWTSLSQETDGQPLTAAKWNAVIDRLNSIDQKSLATAWVNFDGTSCTGGAGANECVIRDSYNINKIIRISAGVYEVYFLSLLTNSNYSVYFSNSAYSSTNGTVSIRTTLKSVDKLKITGHSTSNAATAIYYDLNDVSIQVFGGK